jgi:hypothetical protein
MSEGKLSKQDGAHQMNLSDFETFFDKTILTRGLNYYKSGNVISLEYDDGEWVAEVEGSEDYCVTITLSDDGRIIDTECDCPYDMSNYCKHQAAVFYMLRSEWQPGKTPAKTSRKKDLEAALKKLDKQELLSVILEFANRDRRIKEELFLRYAKKADALESARSVIRSAIKAVERRGFVEYRDVRRAIDGVDTVFAIIDDMIDSDDIMTAVSLCIVVLEEMMGLLDYCDDSDGYVGGSICEATGKIGEAVCSMSSEQKGDEVFNIVFSHTLSPMYDGWTDWRIDLISAVVPLCGNHANRDKMEQYISERQSDEGDGWSKGYEKRELQKIQHSIIKEFDSGAKADRYMEQNLDNSEFRHALIKSAISDGKYEKALKLCFDGENKNSQYAGLMNDWQEYRYSIYEKTQDTEAQKSLGMELLLKGDFEYFKKIKALYNKNQWETVLQNILEKLENSSRNNVYVKILIHESLKSRLLEYCKKHTSAITSYYQHLLPEYKTDIGLIFLSHITERAARANTRSHYKDVCGLIRHYKKACGSQEAYELRDNLKGEYARRPAFLDELGKL